ncbi:MAG: response regulator [Gammaproteobacteria bacterium]
MSVAEATERPPVRRGKPTILFVDDEKRVLNSMRAMFRREYNLFLTTRGDEALKIISENNIDVVVADQRMPIMTGVEVLTAVKNSSPDTVRILLTGYADLDAIEGAMNDGEVFRFLSKPCAAEELRGTIKLATEIAIETNGSASADPDDDSFLDAISTAGSGPSALDSVHANIDDVMNFASTVVLSENPDLGTSTVPSLEAAQPHIAPVKATPLPKVRAPEPPVAKTPPKATPKPPVAKTPVRAPVKAPPPLEAPAQTAEPPLGLVEDTPPIVRRRVDPVISESATIVLDDEDDEPVSHVPDMAQQDAAAILDAADKRLSETMSPLEIAQEAAVALMPGHMQNQEPVEIVMSGDTHQVVDTTVGEGDFGGTTAVMDVAATLTAPAEDKQPDNNPLQLVGTGKYKVSIIVFTSDEQFAKSVGRSLQDYFYTFQASNIARLMHGIQKMAPAVLITDVSEDPEVIEQLAAKLKQKVPEMVTMVASAHRDAELMVRLINHGQVFRMIDKPMSSTACKRHVREAIKKHIQLRDNPDLIQRHQVAKTSGSKLPASIGKLINGLGRVRGLWSRKS